MPAASCRIMPARSISRCETISASFGFSFRIGRKNRDNRMTILRNQWDTGRSTVKPDRVRKHKGKRGEKAATATGFLQFRALKASHVPPVSGRYCLITIGDSTLTLSVSEIEMPRPKYPLSRRGHRHLRKPLAVAAPCGLNGLQSHACP